MLLRIQRRAKPRDGVKQNGYNSGRSRPQPQVPGAESGLEQVARESMATSWERCWDYGRVLEAGCAVNITVTVGFSFPWTFGGVANDEESAHAHDGLGFSAMQTPLHAGSNPGPRVRI